MYIYRSAAAFFLRRFPLSARGMLNLDVGRMYVCLSGEPGVVCISSLSPTPLQSSTYAHTAEHHHCGIYPRALRLIDVVASDVHKTRPVNTARRRC